MKTNETQTSTQPQSTRTKPFFGGRSDQAFFSTERAAATPFFQPPAATAATIQAKEATEEADLDQPTVQRMPAFASEIPVEGAVQRSPSQSSQHPATAVPRTAVLIQAKGNLGGQRQNPTVAQRPNQTGLPDTLKTGIESLSGMSLDNVNVHYNSAQPAQLNALAYAQGTDIYVAPGQEQHLPHEAWHVVQQAQGRVQPTMQMKDGVPVNDDAGLEREADVMGEKALATTAQLAGGPEEELLQGKFAPIQRTAPEHGEPMEQTTKSPFDEQRGCPAAQHPNASIAERFGDNRLETVAQRELADVVNHSPRLIAQNVSIRAVLSSPHVTVRRSQFDGSFEAAQLRSNPAHESYREVEGSRTSLLPYRSVRPIAVHPLNPAIQRISYADAKKDLPQPYVGILDKWLIYQASSGPMNFNESAEKVLGPLNLNQLIGRLSYWLDDTAQHPSGRPKMEQLGSPTAPESEKPWTEIVDASWPFIETKLNKALATGIDAPKTVLKTLTSGKNFELNPQSQKRLVDNIVDSIIQHLLVGTKDIKRYLAGGEKRTFPDELVNTAQTILNHRVRQQVLAKTQEVVAEYFNGENDKLTPYLDNGFLRNRDKAVVDPNKLTGYALKTDHPVGGNKAKIFAAVLGLTVADWQVLNQALLDAVKTEKPILQTGRTSQHGASFTIRFMMAGIKDKAANRGLVESAWIFKQGESFPSLVTCYVEGGGKDWQPDARYIAIFGDDTLVTEEDHPERLPQPTWEYVQSQKTRPRVEKRLMKSGRVYQERHYDANGYPVKDVDYTSPTLPDGRPFADHAPPGHEHKWVMKNAQNHQEGWNREGGEG